MEKQQNLKIEGMDLITKSVIQSMIDDGKIHDLIEKNIENVVKSAVDNAFGHSSDIRKQLEVAVKGAIKINTNDLGLDGYNKFILQVIKGKLDYQIHLSGKERLEKELEDILKTPPTEMKLSELINEFKGDIDREDITTDECTVIIQKQSWGAHWIYIGKKSGESDYLCEHSIYLEENGKISSLRCKGIDFSKDPFCGRLYGFEKTLFQLYAAHSKVIVDEENIDLYFNRDEDEDD